MKNNINLCKICNGEIRNHEPRFYFPRLPASHDLSNLSGISHIACIKAIDDSRGIGKSLAEIAQDMARHSGSAPLILRDGNIVLRARLEEKRIEVLDYEDFCEMSIPIVGLEKLIEASFSQSISLGIQTLHISKNGQLKVESPLFELELSALSFPRLAELLRYAETNNDMFK